MRFMSTSGALVALALASSCSGNLASQIAKPPDLAFKGQAQCGIVANHSKPLVVEWPSADRGELEARVHGQGLVAVAYSGCQMKILEGCSATGNYAYAPITKKKDHVVMRDTDDLYANVPVGAAKLETTLKKSGQLDVGMTVVGRWEAHSPSLREDELSGTCQGATHLISAVTVGAFKFTAGADAEVGGEARVFGAGGGATSASKRETLSSDGSETACDAATINDRTPPNECGAMIRVEVLPLIARPFVEACTGTITLTDSAGKTASAPTPRLRVSLTDNGDGTVTVASLSPTVPCSHKLAVSGATATLIAPYTCQTDRAFVTVTSVVATLAPDGTRNGTGSGTAIVDGKSYAITETSTCVREAP